MAPQLRGSPRVSSATSNSTSITLNTPETSSGSAVNALADGDLWVCVLHHTASTGTTPRTVTPPAALGWQSLTVYNLSGEGLVIYWKIWLTGDATSAIFTLSGNAQFGATSFGFQKGTFEPNTPFGAATGKGEAATTAHSADAITTTRNDSRVLVAQGINSNSAIFSAYPAGWTNVSEVAGKRVDVRYLDVTTSGTSTGAAAFTSDTSIAGVNFQIEVLAAPTEPAAFDPPVRDDATRANENPINATNWPGAIATTATAALQIVSNTIKGAGAGANSRYWKDSYAADQAVSCDITTIDTDTELYLRIQNPNTASLNAIFLYLHGTKLEVGYYLNNVATQIFATRPISGTAFANGDSLKGVISGNILAVYRKPSGGAWALLNCFTLTQVTGAGYTGALIFGTTAAIDNFAAGPLAAAYVDSATAAVALTPSTADTVQAVDSATATLSLTPSGADTYTTAGTAYTDSATAAITLTPTLAEEYTRFDASTVLLQLSPSTSDIRERFDAATATVALTPSASETAQFVDTATATLNLVPRETRYSDRVRQGSPIFFRDLVDHFASAADIIYNGDLFRYPTSDGKPFSVEFFVQLDADATGTVVSNYATGATGGGFEISRFATFGGFMQFYVEGNLTSDYWRLDSPNASFLVGPKYHVRCTWDGVSDIRMYVDGVDVTSLSNITHVNSSYGSNVVHQLAIGGEYYHGVQYNYVPGYVEKLAIFDYVLTANHLPDVEIAQFADTSTAVLALTPSAAEVAQSVDVTTATLALTASSTDIYATAGVYTDAATVSVSLSPTGIDTRAAVDTSNVPLQLSVSGADQILAVDAGTALVLLTPSTSDIGGFVDASTVAVKYSPTAVDTVQYVDVSTSPIALTPSGTDTYTGSSGTVYTDTGTAIIALSTTATDAFTGVDAATTRISYTPSGTDGRETVDSATASIKSTPASVETAQFIDVGFASLGIVATAVDTIQSVSVDTGNAELDLLPAGVELYFKPAPAVLTLTPGLVLETYVPFVVDYDISVATYSRWAVDSRTAYDVMSFKYERFDGAVSDHCVGPAVQKKT